ncbi:hypothetical protein HYS95_03225 [Candidatus Daviesbacteria bacterium]|nr:hypothetical protein [Candidatus Daviesbacteria bacterium]
MFKKLLALIIALIFVLSGSEVLADEKNPGSNCNPAQDICCQSSARPCVNDGSYACQITNTPNATNNGFLYQCKESAVGKIFGLVKPPAPLAGLIKDNPSGAWIISMFFSNFVALLFSIAMIALVFMIIWSAFEWLTSGGDKEKLANAQKRIINAFIGIILFATAFAIIRVLGTFTGFKFFVGQ